MTTEQSNDGCVRICVTPTRNEAWIIGEFLAAAKAWASHIVVADQGSTDGTLERLRKTPEVQAVVNDCSTYDETYRQRLLLEHSRNVTGKRILVALDADEALSANVTKSAEWKRIAEARPGTVLRFRWVNILPGFKKAWVPPEPIACGFIDDGCEHTGMRIHSRRVPWPANAPVIDLDEIVVLHFQYVAWDRMIAKHRWYQAWEHLNNEQKGPLRIFREYNHMYGSWDKSEIHPMKAEWLEAYDRAGINFRLLQSESVTWWDREIVEMLREHRPQHFRRIAIWDADWNAIAARIAINGVDLSDPRSSWEKTVHRLLQTTQKNRTNLGVRGLERILRFSGW